MESEELVISTINSIIGDSETSSDSSSESSSDEEITLVISLKVAKQKKEENTFIDRILPNYSREQFKENFRMYPETFEFLLEMIADRLNKTSQVSGTKPIPAKTLQLLIALWFMSIPDSYRSVSQRFGVGEATAFRALRKVTYILHCDASKFIKWPTGDIALQTMNQFERRNSFPRVIGAIDGTHIQIRMPPVDGGAYINRKGFASIQLQVVCDDKCLFTHCYAGHVGSVHDARVFKNSPIYGYLNDEEYFPHNSHLIGDAAYPLHRNLLVPFKDNGRLTLRQQNYNFCLSSTRMVVERSIGLLKMRFRILLDCLPLTDMKKIPEFIMACCVLHNICVINNEGVLAGYIHRDQPAVQPDNVLPNNAAALGTAKRTEVMNSLNMRLER